MDVDIDIDVSSYASKAASIGIASIGTYITNIQQIQTELANLNNSDDNLALWQKRFQLERQLHNQQEDVLYFQVSVLTSFPKNLIGGRHQK